ncbi:MAG TPA: M13 family metallopeptidase [Kofleriaceae bacterium]|nr:M13 family metallopeptidase [Kofleriaceae bacterium]
MGHRTLCISLAILAGSACSSEQRAAPAAAAPPPAAAPPAPMTLGQAGVVVDWMDRGADPCQDFFQYSCGGFLATQQIPPDRSSWSVSQVVTQEAELFLRDVLEKAAADPGNDPVKRKLGDYWAACMDEAAIERAGAKPLAPLLAVIAGIKDARSARSAVLELHAAGVFPFFVVNPTQDFADATQVIASLDQGGIGLPDRDYYLQDRGNMKTVREAYRAHVGKMLALLGLPAAEVKAAVADAMRIETALARIAQDKVVRRDPHKVYHRIDLPGVEKAAPSFPWKQYLTRMGLDGVTAITVNDPAYFTAMARLLGAERPAALRHYATWRLLDTTATELSKSFVDEDHEMVRVLAGVKEVAPRWRRCVQRADRDLGFLLAQPYVAARFAGESRPRAVELTRAVIAAMIVQLDKLPWMDAATRAAARQKAEKMAYLVGYPDQWRQYDFEVKRDDHAANALAAARFELTRQLGKVGKPVDRADWGMTPPTVNAYYDSSLNQMVLPAGQMQPPFFGATFHPAINFGGTGGSTIGHELTHGFDDEGSQFDASGNLKDWWSKPTKAEFGKASRCVVDQYAQYEAVPGVKLNGKLTAGENIADIGGVKLGFQAYEAWRAQQTTPPPAKVEGMSDDQLYFLAYGQSWCSKTTPESLETRAYSDPHSPAKWRVNGVVVDLAAFAAAFQCRPGAPMNPGHACAVW